MQKDSKRYKGVLFLLISAFAFALSTVFAKLVILNSDISGSEITFFRFFIGFLAILVVKIIQKKSIKPINSKYVILRSVTNTIAVILFFTGIQYTKVTNANMLNMTYPIFVNFFVPFINKEKTTKNFIIYLCITMTGVFLLLKPDINGFNIGDIFALMSGIVAGAAISLLRESRKYDSTFIVLFYLMFIGSIINFIIMLPDFIIPKGVILIYLLSSACFGVLGQLFITSGYKYIDAASGALVSSSTVIFAFILGVFILSEPITASTLIGGLLIIASLIGISGFKIKFNK